MEAIEVISPEIFFDTIDDAEEEFNVKKENGIWIAESKESKILLIKQNENHD